MSLIRDATKPSADANPSTGLNGAGLKLDKEILPVLDRRQQRTEARQEVDAKKEETERRDNLTHVLSDEFGMVSVLTKAKPAVTTSEDRRRQTEQEQQDSAALYHAAKKKKQQIAGIADHMATILIQLGFDPPTSAKIAEAVSKESSVRTDGASARDVAERVARSLFNALPRNDTLARLGISTSDDPAKAEQENKEAIARFTALLEGFVEKELAKEAEETARRESAAAAGEEVEEDVDEAENDDATLFVSADLSDNPETDEVDNAPETDPDDDSAEDGEEDRAAERREALDTSAVDRQVARLEEVLRTTLELDAEKIRRIVASYRTLCESQINPTTLQERTETFARVLVAEIGAEKVLELFSITGAELADRDETSCAVELVTAAILPTLQESEVVALRRNPQPGAVLSYSEIDLTIMRTRLVVGVLCRVPALPSGDTASVGTGGATATPAPVTATVEVAPPPRRARTADEIRLADEAWMTNAIAVFREDTRVELRTALDRSLRDGAPVQVTYDEVLARRQRAFETFLASAEVRDVAARNPEIVRTRSDFTAVRTDTVSILAERTDIERRAAEERARLELRGHTVDPAAAAGVLADRELAPVVQRMAEIGQGRLPGNPIDLLRELKAELDAQRKPELFARALAAYQIVHGRPLLADITSRVAQRADVIDATITRFLDVCVAAEHRVEHRRQFIDFKVREYCTVCAHIETRLADVAAGSRDLHAATRVARADQIRRANELSALMTRVIGRDGMTPEQREALRTMSNEDTLWEWHFSDYTRDMFALADDLIGRQGSDALAVRHPTGGAEITTLRAAIKTAQPSALFPTVANDEFVRERNYWNEALDRTQVELGQLYGKDLVANGYCASEARPVPVTVDVPHAIATRQYVYDYRTRWSSSFQDVMETARHHVQTAREGRGCDHDGGTAGNAACAWAVIELVSRREIVKGDRANLDLLIRMHRARYSANQPSQTSVDAINNYEVDATLAVLRRIASGDVPGDPPKLLADLRTRVGASVFDRAQAAHRAGGADPVLLTIYREEPGCRRLFTTLAALDTPEKRLEYLRQLRLQLGDAGFATVIDAYDRHMGAPLAAHLVQWSGTTVEAQRACLTQLFGAEARLFSPAQRQRFIEYTRAEQALILATVELERERAGAAIAPAEAALYRSREHLANLVGTWAAAETDPARRARFTELAGKITREVNETAVDQSLLAAIHLKFPELQGCDNLSQCCRYIEVVGGAREDGPEPFTVDRVRALLRESGFDIAGAHLYPTDRASPTVTIREDCARFSALLRGRVTLTARVAEMRRVQGVDQGNEIRLTEARFTATYSDLFPEYSAQRFTDARKQAVDYLRNLDLRIQAEVAKGTPEAAAALTSLSAERDAIDWRAATVRMEILLTPPHVNPDRVRALLVSFSSVYSGPMERGELYMQQAQHLTTLFNAIDSYNARSVQLAAIAVQAANGRVQTAEINEENARSAHRAEADAVADYSGFGRNNPFSNYDNRVRERDRLGRVLNSRVSEVGTARTNAAAVTTFSGNDIPASRRALYAGLLQRPGAGSPPGSLAPGSTLRGLHTDLWGGEWRDYSARRDSVDRALETARGTRTNFIVGAPSDFTRRAASVGVAVSLADSTRTATGCATQQDLVAKITGILVTDLAQTPSVEAMAALRASVPPGTPLAVHLEALKDLPPRDQLERLYPRLRTTPDDVLRVQLFLHAFGRPDLMHGAEGTAVPKNSSELWAAIAARPIEEVALLLEILPGMRKLQDIERLCAGISDEDMRGVLEVFRLQNNDTSLGARLLALRPLRDVGATYITCLVSSRLVTNADVAPYFNGPVPVTREQRSTALRASLATDPQLSDVDLRPIRDWMTANLNDRAALMASLELARSQQRFDQVRTLTAQLTDLNRRMDVVIDTTFRDSRYTSDQIERSGIRRSVVQAVDTETSARVSEMLNPTGEFGRDASRTVTLLERGGPSADEAIDLVRSRNYTPAQLTLLDALYNRAAMIPHVAAGTARLAGNLGTDLVAALPPNDPRRAALSAFLAGGRDALVNLDTTILSEAIRLNNPALALQALVALRAAGKLDEAMALLRARSPEILAAYEVLRSTPAWREVVEYREAIRTLATDVRSATVLAVIELRQETMRLKGDADRLATHVVGYLGRTDAALVAAMTAEYSRRYGRELSADLAEFTKEVRGLPREMWNGLLGTDEAKRIAAMSHMAAYALRVGIAENLSPQVNLALLHATRALARTADEAQAVLRDVERMINEGLGPETPRRTILTYARLRNPQFGDSDAALIGRIFGPTPVSVADLEAYARARDQYVVMITELSSLRHSRAGTHAEALNFHTYISNHRSRAIIDMGNVGPISEMFGGREVYRAQVINNNAMYQNQLILMAQQRVGLGDLDNVIELVRLRGVAHLRDIAEGVDGGLDPTQSTDTISEVKVRDSARRWVDVDPRALARWQREFKLNQIAIENYEYNLSLGYTALKVVVITGISCIPFVGVAGAFLVATAWNAADKAYRMIYNGLSFRDATRAFFVELAFDAVCCGLGAARLVRGTARLSASAKTPLAQSRWMWGGFDLFRRPIRETIHNVIELVKGIKLPWISPKQAQGLGTNLGNRAAAAGDPMKWFSLNGKAYHLPTAGAGGALGFTPRPTPVHTPTPPRANQAPPPDPNIAGVPRGGQRPAVPVQPPPVVIPPPQGVPVVPPVVGPIPQAAPPPPVPPGNPFVGPVQPPAGAPPPQPPPPVYPPGHPFFVGPPAPPPGPGFEPPVLPVTPPPPPAAAGVAAAGQPGDNNFIDNLLDKLLGGLRKLLPPGLGGDNNNNQPVVIVPPINPNLTNPPAEPIKKEGTSGNPSAGVQPVDDGINSYTLAVAREKALAEAAGFNGGPSGNTGTSNRPFGTYGDNNQPFVPEPKYRVPDHKVAVAARREELVLTAVARIASENINNLSFANATGRQNAFANTTVNQQAVANGHQISQANASGLTHANSLGQANGFAQGTSIGQSVSLQNAVQTANAMTMQRSVSLSIHLENSYQLAQSRGLASSNAAGYGVSNAYGMGTSNVVPMGRTIASSSAFSNATASAGSTQSMSYGAASSLTQATSVPSSLTRAADANRRAEVRAKEEEITTVAFRRPVTEKKATVEAKGQEAVLAAKKEQAVKEQVELRAKSDVQNRERVEKDKVAAARLTTEQRFDAMLAKESSKSSVVSATKRDEVSEQVRSKRTLVEEQIDRATTATVMPEPKIVRPRSVDEAVLEQAAKILAQEEKRAAEVAQRNTQALLTEAAAKTSPVQSTTASQSQSQSALTTTAIATDDDRFDFAVGTPFGHSFGHKLPDAEEAQVDKDRLAKLRLAKKRQKEKKAVEQARMRDLIIRQLLSQQLPDAMKERLLRMLGELGVSETEYRQIEAQIGQQSARALVEEVAQQPMAMTVDGQKVPAGSEPKETPAPEKPVEEIKRPNRTRADLYRKLKERDNVRSFTGRSNRDRDDD